MEKSRRGDEKSNHKLVIVYWVYICGINFIWYDANTCSGLTNFCIMGVQMKFFVIMALALGLSSVAHAAQCETKWGRKATVTVNGAKLSVIFSERYPSATMTFNGISGDKAYYRSHGVFPMVIGAAPFSYPRFVRTNP